MARTTVKYNCRQTFLGAIDSWRLEKPMAILATLPTSERAAVAPEGWIWALVPRAVAVAEGPSCSPPCQGQKSKPRSPLAPALTPHAKEYRDVVPREHCCLCKWLAGASSLSQGNANCVSLWRHWRWWGRQVAAMEGAWNILQAVSHSWGGLSKATPAIITIELPALSLKPWGWV